VSPAGASGDGRGKLRHTGQRYRGNIFLDGEGMLARVDHPDVVEHLGDEHLGAFREHLAFRAFRGRSHLLILIIRSKNSHASLPMSFLLPPIY